MQDVSQGAERVRAWPKKRGKGVDAAQKERMEWFRQAQWAAKYCDPRMIQTFAEATKGTPLLPRDLMTMMLAGRWLEFTMPDGRVITSVQSKQDVSRSLDVLGEGVGYTLVRGEEYWEFQPIPVGGRYGAQVTRAASTSYPNTATGNPVTFTAEPIDQAAFWIAGQPTRLTVPVQGWYNIEFNGEKIGGSATFMYVFLRVNGVVVQQFLYGNGVGSNGCNLPVSVLRYLNAGNYVEFYIRSFGGVSNVQGIEATIVGPA